jgi:hypothetical protein
MERLIIPGTSEIPLSQGKTAMVDLEDYEHLSQFRWRYRDGYAVTKENTTMHRMIMNPPEGMFVDHINGKRWDNRKENLRICTHKQNNRNRKPHKRKCSSIYKGVTWSKAHGKWVARIIVDHKQVFLGYFADEREAAIAYNTAALKYYGEFARFNEIEKGATD